MLLSSLIYFAALIIGGIVFLVPIYFFIDRVDNLKEGKTKDRAFKIVAFLGFVYILVVLSNIDNIVSFFK